MTFSIERFITFGASPTIQGDHLSRMGFVLALSLVLCGAKLAVASSVAEVALADLVARSAFIFEGKVNRIDVRKAANSGHIWTRVSFDVVDVIKGESQSRPVALDFLGGTYGGKTMQVTEMELPEVGERGVYFVESLTRRQVHPLYGWAQGHFIIFSDYDGTDRVTTMSSHPVLDLEPVDIARHKRKLSTGVARGVVTRRTAALSKAMSLENFKQRLAEMIANR